MKVADQGIYLLDRHLDRLTASARHFKFECNVEVIRDSLLVEIASRPEPVVARLLLSREGKWDVEFRPLPSQGSPTRLRLSSVKVDPTDTLLCHKTTARDVYDHARAGLPHDMDALLSNKRGEITETTIANIAVKRGDAWITPRLSCGLLPGTMRAQLLDDGEVKEGVVRQEDLSPGELIRCFNAVRGVWDARLVL